MTVTLALLLVLTALTMLGNGLVAPVLALYGAEFSASTTLIGMLITVFGLARLCVNFPAGLASDRFGARAILVVATLLLLVGSIGAAAAQDIVALLVARGVQGMGSGIFMTAVGVLVARQSKAGSRGRTMALYNGSIFVGASFGPVAGGFLAERFGLSAPFWGYASVAVAALVVSLFAESARPGTADGGKGAGKARLVELLKSLRFLAVCLVSFLQGAVRTAALWLLLPLLAAERFGMGFAEIGLALTVVSIGNLATLPIGGWLVDKVGARRITPLSLLGMASALLLVGLGPLPALFWGGVMAFGLLSGINSPTVGASTIEVSPPSLYGPVMGLQRTMVDTGFVGGPLLAGFLRDVIGFGVLQCLIAIAAVMVATGIFWAIAWQIEGNAPAGG